MKNLKKQKKERNIIIFLNKTLLDGNTIGKVKVKRENYYEYAV